MNDKQRRLLIVDDEKPARERLQALVDELPGWTCVGTAASGVEAIERVESERPAVVLLDIRMPGMSGIEVARHLSAAGQPPAVIFTTAYDQYALEAFDSRAVAYLLKPVRRERLEGALTHAARLADALLRDLNGATSFAPRQHIAARAGYRLKLIPLSEIRYFRAEQKYVTVHHASGNDLIDEPLKQLEDEFGAAFVRIHRSVLVAVAAIDALEKDADGGYHVRLRDDGETLAVSRRQVGDVKAKLGANR